MPINPKEVEDFYADVARLQELLVPICHNRRVALQALADAYRMEISVDLLRGCWRVRETQHGLWTSSRAPASAMSPDMLDLFEVLNELAESSDAAGIPRLNVLHVIPTDRDGFTPNPK